MPDPRRPIALVLARADNPLLPQLDEALAQQGLACVTCAQAAQAFIQLARRDAAEASIVVAIILEALSGMSVSTLAKSLRGLPGRAGLPLILVEDLAIAPVRALVLRPPVTVADLARLAATPPDRWVPTTAGSPTAAAATDPRPGPIQQAGIILVVDDHPINRTMMCLQAKSAGLPIEACDDGAAAVTRVAAGGVRLVLMDCQMPVMDGYEATRAIRRSEAGTAHRLPIIAVTAHAMAENRQRCLEAGMDDFLAKPITQEQLVLTIKRWLAAPVQTEVAAGEGHTKSGAILDPQPLLAIEQSAAGSGRMLAGILMADLQPFAEAVQQHLGGDDLAGLGQRAHKLKGASGSLGAMELYQACSDLEQEARRSDRAACARAAAVALQSVDRLRPVLSTFLESLPKG